MANLAVQIFTFTSTESAAVDELVTGMATATVTWTLVGERTIMAPRRTGAGNAVIRHTPLSAQGNVVAATALTKGFTEAIADYYIFYGCCGVVDAADVGKIFRVASVSYLSLGVVRNPKTTTGPQSDEVVKLKNKWIVLTDPADQSPLPTITLPAGAPGQPGTVDGLDIADAHVLATDKVINVPPATLAPAPITPGGNVYAKGEWTYAQSLAQYANSAAVPVLVDMESFGIASTALALGRDLRVLVLRVATDALSDKPGQSDAEQQRRLTARLPELAAVLARIIDFSG